MPPTEKDSAWYKDAIIYELHVRPFTTATGTGSETFGACWKNSTTFRTWG